MLQTLTHITLAGRPCVLPDPARFPAVAGRANSFWCPIGAAHGRGAVLLLRRDLAPLLAQSSNRHTLVLESGLGPHARLALPDLLITHTHRLTSGEAAADASLYLVELADRRWLLERFTDTGSLPVNLRSFAQAAPHLADTGGYTWSTAAAALWDTMTPLLGLFPGLPAGYAPAGAPEHWHFTGTSAWQALHELLAAIACTTIYDPVKSTFTIARLAAAQTNLPADLALRPRLYDAEPLAAPAAGLPETIRVYFPTHAQNFGQEPDVELADNWLLAGHTTSIDVPTALAAAEPGTVLTLWDDLPQWLDETNTASNASELTTRAAARAQAWLEEHQLTAENTHQVFPHIAADLRPGTQLKAILWRAFGPDAGGTATETFAPTSIPTAPPWELAARETCACRCDGQSRLAPPQLPAHTTPHYPRVAQTVEAYHSAATPYGSDLAANAAGLVPGRVVRYLAGAMTTSEPCWIRPISLAADNDPGTLTPLRHGDRFLGRLSGTRTALGVARPVYLVQTARTACRKFAARASGTLDISGSPQPFDLDTLETNSGDIAELTANGEILSHVEGPVELRYKVVADRLDLAGGATHYECYVQQSDDDGFSWSELPDSRTAQICRHSLGGNSSVAAPAIAATSQNGTRFRLIFLGITGPAEVRTRAHQCQLFLTPCGGATTVTADYGLLAAWTPGSTAATAEPSLITSELVLADNGNIARATGDEETHSWDFDATDDYLSLAARLLDTDADFTVRMHFKLLAHPTVFQPFPLFIQHQAGNTSTRDALIQIYKQASDANSEIAAGVQRTGSPATTFLINSIVLNTWTTVYLRWDASTAQATLSLVGGTSATSSPATGARVSITTPTIAIAGSPDWSGSYGDLEIDSLRLWHRRLADHELS